MRVKRLRKEVPAAHFHSGLLLSEMQESRGMAAVCRTAALKLSPRERASNGMISVNLNSGGTATLHNLSPYLLSDIDGEIVVSFPSVSLISSFLAKLYHYASCYESRTTNGSCPDIDLSEVASRLAMSGMRSLRLVVRRKPVGFQPHPEQAPNMISIYVVETLECGHEQTYYFIEDVEVLTAKRRVCHQCHGLSASLPPKKPAQSVRLKRAQEVA